MNKSKVALVKCDSYNEEEVYNAVQKGVDLLGGAANFVREGEKIVLKPNVLFGTDPDKCVTTHPSVFRAAALVLKQVNAVLSFGDSPGFGKCESSMKNSRLKEQAEKLGVRLADFDDGKEVVLDKALLNKRFVLANGVLEADGLVSLPKFKTHGLTRFTGAVKNQFGCVPGLRKSQFHVKMADPYKFATMLVDLNMLIKPRLFIMDGIMAMEGNGPRNGQPRKLGVLLFSSDPIALDAIACKIIYLNPEFVPTSRPGEEAGLGTYHFENIEVLGEDVKSFLDKDFDVVREPPLPASSGRIRTFIKDQICPRPVINEKKCSNCGTCVASCPVSPKAVDWHSGDKSRPPSYKYDRCIRCFCCQEMCPQGAITLREPAGSRLFKRLA